MVPVGAVSNRCRCRPASCGVSPIVVADLVADHHEGLRDLPPLRRATRAELDALLREPPPEAPGDVDDALRVAAEVVMGHMQLGHHPRYFARVPSPSTEVGPLADALAAGFNAIATSWAGGSGPTALELVVTDWLAQLLGMPAGHRGRVRLGRLESSLTAFAAARPARMGGHDPDATVYCSAQTHASLPRALRALGFAGDRCGSCPATTPSACRPKRWPRRSPPTARPGCGRFARSPTRGRRTPGRSIRCSALADLAASKGLWLHVDGAYGAPAALTNRARCCWRAWGAPTRWRRPAQVAVRAVRVRVLLVREPGLLAGAFSLDGRRVPGRHDERRRPLRDRSLQLTRATRALKLWLTIETFGVDESARRSRAGSRWPSTPRRPAADAPAGRSSRPRSWRSSTSRTERRRSGAIAAALLAEGYAVASSTVLDGRAASCGCARSTRARPRPRSTRRSPGWMPSARRRRSATSVRRSAADSGCSSASWASASAISRSRARRRPGRRHRGAHRRPGPRGRARDGRDARAAAGARRGAARRAIASGS